MIARLHKNVTWYFILWVVLVMNSKTNDQTLSEEEMIDLKAELPEIIKNLEKELAHQQYLNRLPSGY